MDWTPTEKDFSTCSTSRDSQDLRAVLLAISRADPIRAAHALERTLSDESNRPLRKEYKRLTRPKEDRTLERLILEGVRESIAHHTRARGPRHAASETFVKNVCTACLFRVAGSEDGPSDRALARLVGASPCQIAMARKRATELKETGELVAAVPRRKRRDFVRDKFKPYVYDFLLDDAYTTVDSRQSACNVIDPRTGEEVSQRRRIWRNANKTEQHLMFLGSDHYANFQQENDGATATSKGVWTEALREVGGFVRNPGGKS